MQDLKQQAEDDAHQVRPSPTDMHRVFDPTLTSKEQGNTKGAPSCVVYCIHAGGTAVSMYGCHDLI